MPNVGQTIGTSRSHRDQHRPDASHRPDARAWKSLLPNPTYLPQSNSSFFFRLSHPALNSTRPQKFCLMSIGSPFDCCDASYTGAAVELNDESPKGCRKVRVGSCHSSRSSRVLDSLRRPADVVGKCCEPASKRVHSQRETCTRGGIRAVPAAS